MFSLSLSLSCAVSKSRDLEVSSADWICAAVDGVVNRVVGIVAIVIMILVRSVSSGPESWFSRYVLFWGTQISHSRVPSKYGFYNSML